MSRMIINGGVPLSGSVTVQGAKNSVLPIMAAAVLTGGKTVIHNCPRISDVECSLRILDHLGCVARWEGDGVYIDTGTMTGSTIPDDLMGDLRSSVIFMGAVLARTGRVRFSPPGGCEIGPRPIDLHLEAMKRLGASAVSDKGSIICRADRLHGAVIELRFPSVGATENAMIAAAGCCELTVIKNAAAEPEISDLAEYLRKAGASVTGDGTGTIEIRGGRFEKSVVHEIIPDRIVTATYLAATAATGGHVRVEGTRPDHLGAVLEALSRMGCEVETGNGTIVLDAGRGLVSPGVVVTGPYPRFPTDAQPLLMAACLKARGETVFEETVFENRFRHVPEMIRMGADISVKGHRAAVRGVNTLRGAEVSAGELRGCAALIAAALSADGESTVGGIKYLDRGYDGLCRGLRALGADIRRID